MTTTTGHTIKYAAPLTSKARHLGYLNTGVYYVEAADYKLVFVGSIITCYVVCADLAPAA
jgi:hypothetical protein